LLSQPGCRTARPEVAFTQEPWTFCEVAGAHLATEHFDVYTTVDSPHLIEALPLFVETAYARYAHFVPPRPDASGRLTTYLFGTREEWEAFTAARFPNRHDVYARIRSGGFTEGTVSAIFFKSADTTLATIAHEGWHQYVASQPVSPLPAWLNEGLATACESYEYGRGRPVFHADRNVFRARSLEEAVTGDRLYPLGELLDLDAGELLESGDPQTIQSYYAQVWALIMFLQGLDDDFAPGSDGDFARASDDDLTGESNDDFPAASDGDFPQERGDDLPQGLDDDHRRAGRRQPPPPGEQRAGRPFERLLADLHDGTMHLRAGAAALTEPRTGAPPAGGTDPATDGSTAASFERAASSAIERAASWPALHRSDGGHDRSVFAAYFGPADDRADRAFRAAAVKLALHE